MNIAANALTFHLQKLANVDLVSSQRQGQFIIYSAVFSNLLELADDLVGACCADSYEKCDPSCPTTGFGPSNIGYTTVDDDPIEQTITSLK